MLTPSGRLLKRSAHAEDRPAVYAAQFALSHACWLLTYPLAGWLITLFGPAVAFALLSLLAAAGVIGGITVWLRESGEPVTHSHSDLPGDHPHIKDGRTHNHPIVIDGASDVITEIFGDIGKHARFAVGAASLPLDSTVEVDAIIAVRP